MGLYPETPARVDAIVKGLREAGLLETGLLEPIGPAASGTDGLRPEVLGTVHDVPYLTFLAEAHKVWRDAGREGELASATFAGRQRGARPPRDPLGQVGYYGFDTTPLVAGTWEAARAAAACALTAAEWVAAEGGTAYALCRPPGHHAGPDSFGGYCYLNNAALAAVRLADQGDLAILDIDYHHGNGTQAAFYGSDRVFFVSLHADPDWEYPLYWGRADEAGEGAGHGYNCNLPLPPHTGDATYLEALRDALEAIADFDPAALVLSAGFDGFSGDPLGQFELTPDGFGRIGEAIAGLGLPTVVVQEGGYSLDGLPPHPLHPGLGPPPPRRSRRILQPLAWAGLRRCPGFCIVQGSP
jgi:acetoin utilization deacetylase AcuC-like enzyme